MKWVSAPTWIYLEFKALHRKTQFNFLCIKMVHWVLLSRLNIMGFGLFSSDGLFSSLTSMDSKSPTLHIHTLPINY